MKISFKIADNYFQINGVLGLIFYYFNIIFFDYLVLAELLEWINYCFFDI